MTKAKNNQIANNDIEDNNEFVWVENLEAVDFDDKDADYCKYTYADFADDVIGLLSGDEVAVEAVLLMIKKANDLMAREQKKKETAKKKPKKSSVTQATIEKAKIVQGLLNVGEQGAKTGETIVAESGLSMPIMQISTLIRYMDVPVKSKEVRIPLYDANGKEVTTKKATAYYIAE